MPEPEAATELPKVKPATAENLQRLGLALDAIGLGKGGIDLRGRFTIHNREVTTAFFAGLILGILFVKFLGMPHDNQIDIGVQLAIYLGVPAATAGGLAGYLKKFAKK